MNNNQNVNDSINTLKKINFFQSEFLRNLPCSSETLKKSYKNHQNDIFYKKYYKYKKKYLDKKNKLQNGGAILGEEGTIFNIYTTGLTNWLDAREDQSSNQNIAKIYNDLKENFFNNIPPRFNVRITHYDPMIGSIDASANNTELIKNLCKNIDYLNNVTNNDVIINPIIVHSEFIAKGLTLEDINRDLPYMILDFAHVFTYTANPNVVEYGRNYQVPTGIQELDLNVIRPGFLGDIIPSAVFGSRELFRINDSNQIITLNKKMRRTLPYLLTEEYWYNGREPSDLFINLIREGIRGTPELERINPIKHRLENQLRELLSLSLDEAQRRVQVKLSDVNFVKNITNKIISAIWNDMLPNNLNASGRADFENYLNLITGEIIQENYEEFLE